MKCGVTDCPKPIDCRGLCKAHGARLRRYGDPLHRPSLSRRPETERTCSIDDCTKRHKAQGLCAMHYRRVLVHGDSSIQHAPRQTVEDRFWSKVNKTDTCWLWLGGSRSSDGYGGFRLGSIVDGTARMMQAHRWAYEAANGPIPDGLYLDHLCRVRACVRPDHLEPVSNQENIRRGRVAEANRARKGVWKRPPRSERVTGR